eukprot:3117873-Amphidinium_carterae.2
MILKNCGPRPLLSESCRTAHHQILSHFPNNSEESRAAFQRQQLAEKLVSWVGFCVCFAWEAMPCSSAPSDIFSLRWETEARMEVLFNE